MDQKQKGAAPRRRGIVERVVDAAVRLIAPRSAVQRERARIALELMPNAEQTRELLAGYAGARRDRGPSYGKVGSADHDLVNELPQLRDASRSLVRDDAHASAVLDVKLDNVVGTGFVVQSDVRPEDTGLSPDECEAFKAAAEDLWREWSDGQCDATATSDFVAMTRTLYRADMLDGESFVTRESIRSPGRRVGTAFCIVDSDRIDQTKNDMANRIVAGIQRGDRGEAVAYFIRPHHEDDRWQIGVVDNLPVRFDRSVRIGGMEVPNVIHTFARKRPGQTRGEPLLTPVLPLFEHLHHYLDSEIIAARVNAQFAVLIERPIDAVSDPDIVAEVKSKSGVGSDGQALQYFETLEPGIVEYLNPGEKVTSFGHNRPGTTFDPFVSRILRAIGCGVGLAYELIVRDYKLNYSAARALLLEVRRGFDVERNRLISQWVRPAYRTVIADAIYSGALPLNLAQGRSLEPFLRARYIGSPWGWVDPTKEVQAAVAAIAANLSTPDREAARAGMDLGDVLREKARGIRMAFDIADQYGVPREMLLPSDSLSAGQNGSVAGSQDPSNNPDPAIDAPDSQDQAA